MKSTLVFIAAFCAFCGPVLFIIWMVWPPRRRVNRYRPVWRRHWITKVLR